MSGKDWVNAGVWVEGVLKASQRVGQDVAVKYLALAAVVVMGLAGLIQRPRGHYS
ncbi:MAG TPA: hypothetical protein VGZ73_14375 [Bryobacteraceae bacterium]|jgi:hypothetical protein|nr:hypothetical protein [Bryobacteraceae bacterium]